MKHCLPFLLLCLLSTGGFAQQVAKTGGTSNSTFLLGNTGYARKSQLLYWPSDLAGTQSGNIVRIYFKRGTTGTNSDQVLTDFTLRMGQTTATGFTNSTFFTDLTLVVDTPSITLPAGAAGTWLSINLDSHFVYDASKTLIVETAFQSSTIASWGTYGTNNNPVKKIITPDISAATGSGTSSTWQDFGFDLGVTESGPMISTRSEFLVFPNPASGEISFRLPDGFQEDRTQAEVFTLLGKKVKSIPIHTGIDHVISISELPPGEYLVCLFNGKRRIFSRLVKS